MGIVLTDEEKKSRLEEIWRTQQEQDITLSEAIKANHTNTGDYYKWGREFFPEKINKGPGSRITDERRAQFEEIDRLRDEEHLSLAEAWRQVIGEDKAGESTYQFWRRKKLNPDYVKPYNNKKNAATAKRKYTKRAQPFSAYVEPLPEPTPPIASPPAQHQETKAPLFTSKVICLIGDSTEIQNVLRGLANAKSNESRIFTRHVETKTRQQDHSSDLQCKHAELSCRTKKDR